VPEGTKAVYEAADVWKTFGTIVDEPTGNTPIKVATLKAYASNGVLHITGLRTGKPLSVYSLTGQLIYQGLVQAEVEHIPLSSHGVCIVVSGNQTVKVVQ
jgi:hypothetical protein